ncbi:hypothetical protein M0802_003869 [Mischocyttarus mexicanus]|nr:hypothetical protein M0802_003869 [Mischocyttarus mexicanus]
MNLDDNDDDNDDDNIVENIEQIRCPGYHSGAKDYPLGTRCHIRCRRGFELAGVQTRNCLTRGRWSGEAPVCYRESSILDSHIDPDMPRPFVRCPQDMDVELPARQNTINVSFSQPKSNMNWWRYVDASPPWAKKLQGELPAGTTVITFTAWSPVSNYTSTCRIVIRVRDTENPKVSTCPTSFEVRLGPDERDRRIFWQEPTFTDNVGVDRIYKTRSRVYRTKLMMCPGRPPQRITSTYGWQIPRGCYLRYTRIFSGSFAVQRGYRDHRQNSYQDARAAYHEIHPVQRTQARVLPPLPWVSSSTAYPIEDSKCTTTRCYHSRSPAAS